MGELAVGVQAAACSHQPFRFMPDGTARIAGVTPFSTSTHIAIQSSVSRKLPFGVVKGTLAAREN
jgi:hypothetical protein